MRTVYSHYILILLIFIGCAAIKNQKQLAFSHDNNPMLYGFNEVIDFNCIKPGDISTATSSMLKDTDHILTDILKVNHIRRTFENTLIRVDDLYDNVSKMWNLIELLSSTHPSEEIRNEADENDLKIQEYMIDLSINEDLYQAILTYSKINEAKTLTDSRKRFLQSELRDFKRSGMHLPLKKRYRLKKIQTRLAELGIIFANNISSYEDTLFINDGMASGLPDDYKIDRLMPNGRYAIDLSYPSIDPFMKYADSEELRKRLRFKYLNIAATENIEILNKIISGCNEMAEILGYSSYASFVIEEGMAKTPTSVWLFVNRLRKGIEKKASKDIEEMLLMKRELSGEKDDNLYDWDKYYYENQILLNNYNVDSEKVKEYFELNSVIEGLFKITGTLFGLQYNKIENPSVWHTDVTMYEVVDSQSDKIMGRFYLDLYPRAHKYKHAAEFTIVSGKQVGELYQYPVASLVCNFPKSTSNHPSLLSHDDVLTLFHEFGHLIHDIVSRTELMSQSGTSVVMDFVEAPSQMLENWAWNKESLHIFAKHYKTGEDIPSTLIDRLISARNLQSGNDILQQIFYSMLDLTLYDGYDPDGPLSTTDIVMQLQNTITHYPYFEGTHQQASFGHLLDYAASYYGYLWSEVYAQDMFSIFKEGGILNPKIGNRYRKSVLEKGDSENSMNLVIDFMGREPNNEAFLKSMGMVE